MYALDNSSGVSVMPEIKSQVFSADEPRWFTEGGNGVSPSYPGADWFNIVQAELLNVVKASGGTPNKLELNQLTAAIQAMIDATNTANVSLKNILIGVPIPYPLSTVPEGCLAMNGQRFDTLRYPKLAQKYPSGQLPDFRGEFLRGWDNGRGVDAGRALLSSQEDAIRNITGGSDNILKSKNTANRGAFSGSETDWRPTLADRSTNLSSINTGDSSVYKEISISFDASRVVPTANENRPRNIAYHYICLAE